MALIPFRRLSDPENENNNGGAPHAVANADDQIVENGFIFIKRVRHHLIDNFLHYNGTKDENSRYFPHLCMIFSVK